MTFSLAALPPARSLAFALVVSTSSLIPFQLSAQGLSASDLWKGWQAQVAATGGKLTAAERREGTVLVLEDVAWDLGNATGNVIGLQSLHLVSQADGSVGLRLPDSFELTLRTPILAPPQHATAPGNSVTALPQLADGARVVTLAVRAPNHLISIFGLGETADVQARIPEFDLRLAAISPPPPQGEMPAFDLAAKGFDLRYKHDFTKSLAQLDTAFTLASFTAAASAGENAAADFGLTFATQDAHGALAWAVPREMLASLQAMPLDSTLSQDAIQALDLLERGLSISGTLELGETRADVRAQGPANGTVTADLDIGRAKAALSLSKTGLASEAKVNALALDLSAPDASDVFSNVGTIGLEEYRVALNLGLNGLRGPQDWRAAYVLRNLDLSEAFWARTDPKAALPRDPLSLVLDLAGSYTWLPAALEPDWTPSEGQSPLQAFSATTQEVLLEGLGAQIDAKGGVEIAFPTEASLDEMPLPEGKLTLDARGIYALMERLVDLGVISAQDATGARMALLAFAAAGAAPDTLTSDLEFRDGGFYLNGQKIR